LRVDDIKKHLSIYDLAGKIKEIEKLRPSFSIGVKEKN
jgi:hypothetical protein